MRNDLNYTIESIIKNPYLDKWFNSRQAVCQYNNLKVVTFVLEIIKSLTIYESQFNLKYFEQLS